MATTDAKSGFRLPWSADRNESESQVDGSVQGAVGEEQAGAAPGHEAPSMTNTGSSTPDWGTRATEAAPSMTRKPNKFMADLTKAMQAAAEAARADTLERFGAEAKAHIENIHASTADEATNLRKKADDDIAAIRDWSKTEIARIREETDERIAHRKDVLEREIETNAAQIEARIERVQQHVANFEAQMAAFFDRLLAEEDPTRFAAMAESLPEPPPFDADIARTAPAIEEAPAVTAEAAPVAEPAVVDASEVEPISSEAPAVEAIGQAESTDGGLIGTEAATPHGYIEPLPSAWGEPATPERVAENTVPTEDSRGLVGIIGEETPPAEATFTADHGVQAETDPRLDALGINADFAAAEAEAGAVPTESESTQEEIPVIADDALAARLAGLVPDTATSGETATTRVIVTGLVSVASIAGFKRNLARVSGVHSVGVTSGPDGEFVFTVSHDAGLQLGESITTLQGFGARVTNESAGELTVAARDPEAEG